MDYLLQAEQISNIIIEWRRELHKIPEIGTDLPKTRDYVCKILKENNIPYQIYKNHTGISALLGNPNGKCIALRADMDALPIEEETNLPYSSIHKSCMHACGHDSHTAMLLGAARLLKENEKELKGCIKLIFQTGEETGDGALAFINDGILENPKVDAMISMHIDRANGGMYKNGDFIIKFGATHASNDEFKIVLHGKSAHGGYPHNSIDPVIAASEIIQNLENMISREVPPTKSALISFGGINSSSSVNNIIPESVTLIGTIRNQDNELREFVNKRFVEIVNGSCQMLNIIPEISIRRGESPVKNDKEMTRLIRATAQNLFGAADVHSMHDHTMGAEDVGYYFEKVPGTVFRLCNPLPYKDGIIYPLHSSKMILDDSKLYRGSALLAQSAVNYLSEN